eukprot:TRINITY_DN270_c0_g1_i1.p1 TRINITY_DN270_c0_g1~~TRINITY_DN270_c0_g1_i1.p1  ORF type:complete len:704 (+),score=234.41 TRINITY_DN270_c0_g1_i1:188-2113(+)
MGISPKQILSFVNEHLHVLLKPAIVCTLSLTLAYFLGYFGFSLVWTIVLIAATVESIEILVKRLYRVGYRQAKWEAEDMIDPSAERVRWITRSLRHLLPMYGDPLLLPLAFKEINAILAEKKVAGTDITLLGIEGGSTLGNFPPELKSIKVHDTEPELMRIDAEVEFDSDFKIVVKIKGALTAGVPVTMKISNLFFKGKASIEAQLIPRLPCVKKVSVTLLEKPEIDISVAPYGTIDIFEIPGVAMTIKKIITTTVEEMLLWPKRFTIDIEDVLKMKDGRKMTDEEVAAAEEVEGKQKKWYDSAHPSSAALKAPAKFASRSMSSVGKGAGMGASALGKGASSVGSAGMSGMKSVGGAGVSGVKSVGGAGMSGAKSVGSGAKSVGDAGMSGVKSVGGAGMSGVKSVGGAGMSGVKSVGSGAKSVGKALTFGVGSSSKKHKNSEIAAEAFDENVVEVPSEKEIPSIDEIVTAVVEDVAEEVAESPKEKKGNALGNTLGKVTPSFMKRTKSEKNVPTVKVTDDEDVSVDLDDSSPASDEDEDKPHKHHHHHKRSKSKTKEGKSPRKSKEKKEEKEEAAVEEAAVEGKAATAPGAAPAPGAVAGVLGGGGKMLGKLKGGFGLGRKSKKEEAVAEVAPVDEVDETF